MSVHRSPIHLDTIRSFLGHPAGMIISANRTHVFSLRVHRNKGAWKQNCLYEKEETIDMYRLIQFGVVAMIWFFSALVSWYEGSAILDDPWEWKYSTPFSHWLAGPVVHEHDISQLDYFVYAAKFRPVFPSLLIVCTVYLLILAASYLNQRTFAYVLFVFSATLPGLALPFMDATTTGGTWLAIVLSGCALVCAALGAMTIKNHSVRQAKS